ncbi:tetratricopeptide repeat protein [Pseudomarimonas salicorniae]|uniref:Tetratricopeptide repeat protein n=1 Tax=Pseudomarimonas salicorniae TaxID=2933270 RepID=A0ABT0GH78_9GAMM|nr:tetratricopeptide repeat protein [Lysobacter sp. CAU 1642]MCK7593881.1 tetratricopeptide repeat protein [Lysobacter sp. CAU 1642]
MSRPDFRLSASPLRLRATSAALTALLLAACATAPAPVPVVAEVPPPPPPRDLLAEVRAAAADAGDVIEVAPLRDGTVVDLLEQAEDAERRGDIAAAERALRQAVDLVPDDPDLMQRRAELLLAQRALDEAEQLAARSFERGPRLGPLCRRNWTTVRLAREERGDAGGAENASRQAARCLIEPPVRM